MTTVQDKAAELLELLYAEGQLNVENVNSGTAVTLSTPDVFSTTVLTLNGASPVITIPAPASAHKGQRKRVYAKQDGTGSRVPSFAGATINWLSGNAPTFSTTPAAIDRIDLESLDGTTWEGTFAQGTTVTETVYGTQTFVSGTAIQNPSETKWTTYYVEIINATAGTVAVAVGPDNTTAHPLIPATAANAAPAGSAQHIPVRVPPGGWVKVTVAVATITASSPFVTE